MIAFSKNKRLSTLLGLSLDGNQLEAVALRRTNGSVQVQQFISAPLALSPLSGDSALVGRDLRNHLEKAGIRERKCVVCLPLNWLLTVQLTVPAMPEEDVSSFLQIEAERGFHSDLENLVLSSSVTQPAPDGSRQATLMAVPRAHVVALEAALKAAQLKPLAFSLGVAALAGGQTGLWLHLGPHTVDALVLGQGGILVLRSLDGVIEGEGAQRFVDTAGLARELRISLGHLPETWSMQLTSANLFLRGEMARNAGPELSRLLQASGRMRVDTSATAPRLLVKPVPPAELTHSIALALAARVLLEDGAVTTPQFLPPKISPWQQWFSGGLSSRKLIWAGAAAGAVVFLVLLAFVVQQIQIMSLQSEWKSMASQVGALQEAKDNIRKFRPWFDTAQTPLRTLRRITESFPQEATVTAKSLSIRDGTVTCSGVARTKPDCIAMQEKLSTCEEISNVRPRLLLGQGPVQFTLDFSWEGGSAHGR